MKRRNPNALIERDGVVAVTSKCNSLDLIWRDLLQEDVGVDGTIEVVIDGFPTGKLVGGQIKSGISYIRGESDKHFKFYADSDDVEYWRSLTLPLFLFVHDPRSNETYWFDVQAYMETRTGHFTNSVVFEIPKTNVLDVTFRKHLETLFDLTTYSETAYKLLIEELKSIAYQDGKEDLVSVSGLDLFVKGLWGLCTKVQFHLSLLTSEIRKQLVDRGEDSHIMFDLSRAKLFPFISAYFNLLTRHHLAVVDMSDINLTLYSKMEWPTFIAPLTLNGRKFVEYLRSQLGSSVRDHQFLSFTLYPHVQVEVFASFDPDQEMPFGHCTDVLIIKFNPYLDYYNLLHLERPVTGGLITRANQNIFYYELLDYLKSLLDNISKDNINCRYQDTSVSPLTCWINKYLNVEDPTPLEYLQQRPLSEQAAFNEELLTILTPGATAATITGDRYPQLNLLFLSNGEMLINELSTKDGHDTDI